ncbi:hypothetical protein [Pseudomonas sp. CGJS7]|uniref:hypothetical protein n=1 Tax=Pseudomonas sp. CGJS7 TaxID=3109348 RepID=UPI0030098262
MDGKQAAAAALLGVCLIGSPLRAAPVDPVVSPSSSSVAPATSPTGTSPPKAPSESTGSAATAARIAVAQAWLAESDARIAAANAPGAQPPLPAVAPVAGSDPAARAAQAKARLAEAKARGAARRNELIENLKRRQAMSADMHTYSEQKKAEAAAAELAAKQEEQRRLLDPATARPALQGSEQQVRDALEFQGRALVKQGRLREAETIFSDYVAQRRRTPSGLWMSGLFFSGVGTGLLENVPENAQAQRWKTVEEQTLDWARKSPESPLPRLLHAHILFDHAWEVRGGRYAVNTPKQVWKPFKALIARTAKYLDRERAVASRAPEYYWILLKTLRSSDGGGDHLTVLEQGERAFPGYYPSYFAMFTTLMPKWHGSVEHIEAFAEAAAQRTERTDGAGMYARIYWYAAQDTYRFNLFKATGVRWERMKQGFDDVIQRYPDQWNLQNYARFACDAQDRDKLAELLAKIDGPPMMEAWSNPQLFEKCSELAGRLKL